MEVFSLRTKEEQSLVVPSTGGTQTRASGVRAAEALKLKSQQKAEQSSITHRNRLYKHRPKRG